MKFCSQEEERRPERQEMISSRPFNARAISSRTKAKIKPWKLKILLTRSAKMSQPSISSFFKPAKKPQKEVEAPDITHRLPSSSNGIADVISIDDESPASTGLLPTPPELSEPFKVKEESQPAIKRKPAEVINIENFKYAKKPGSADEPERQDDESDYANSAEKQLIHQRFADKLKNRNALDYKRRESSAPSEMEGSEESQSQSSASWKRRKKNSLTPLDAQIVELKKENMDKLLAINVGYKYKFFGPDAGICASILNIMMIPGKESVNGENPNDVFYDKLAYCSIPENRLHIHLKRLISRGYKVGVVEQTETAAIKSLSNTKNSLFERKLTNVYTSATYVEDEKEDAIFGTKGGDSIIAIVESIQEGEGFKEANEDDNVNISIVSVNPVSGEIVHDNFQDDYLRTEIETRLYHLQPSEYVIFENTSDKTYKKLNFLQKTNYKVRVNRVPRTPLQTAQTYTNDLIDYCQNHIHGDNKGTMIDFFTSLPANTQTCCFLLIDYLKDFKLENSFQMRGNYEVFSRATSMVLNANTLASLEIFENSTTHTEKGSLIELLDHTKTIFGYRLLKQWVSKPLVDREQIEERLEAISNIKSNSGGMGSFIEILSNLLNGVPDLEKYLSRIHYLRSKRKEIFRFLKSIDTVVNSVLDHLSDKILGLTVSPLLKTVFQNLRSLSKELSSPIKSFLADIDVQSAMDEKDSTGQVTKFFSTKSEYFEEINKTNEKIKDAELELQEELRRIKRLLQKPHMKYKSIAKEEYLIEISRANAKKIPSSWVKINDTRTLIRYRSPQIIDLLKQLNYHRAMLINVCEKVYFQFLAKIDQNYLQLRFLIKQLATLDCLFSLTAASISVNSYVRPKFVDQKIISVKEGRNPIIEYLLTDSYIPNDINMRDHQNRALILTGPNMGGKSSYVRQIALIVIMAQIGCFVPAQSAVLGVFDSVFTRMGFNDNIIKGESTFMVEMNECCNIIRNCTSNSLVILDEVGRGTGTTDGISIAYAILDYLLNSEKQPLTLFITHYTEICEIAKQYPKVVKNVHMDYSEIKDVNDKIGTVTFLYKVVDGYAKNSYGLNVAKLSSVPEHIIDQAFEISRNLENKVLNNREISWSLNLREFISSAFSDNKENITSSEKVAKIKEIIANQEYI